MFIKYQTTQVFFSGSSRQTGHVGIKKSNNYLGGFHLQHAVLQQRSSQNKAKKDGSIVNYEKHTINHNRHTSLAAKLISLGGRCWWLSGWGTAERQESADQVSLTYALYALHVLIVRLPSAGLSLLHSFLKHIWYPLYLNNKFNTSSTCCM